MTHPNKSNSLKIAGMIILIGLALLSCNRQNDQRVADLNGQIDSLRTRLQKSLEEVEYWKAQAQQTAMPPARTGNSATDSLRLLELINDLYKHKELLPQEKRCEEGSQLFFLEGSVHKINDYWVVASFEDGLCGGEIILEYKRDSGTIKWKPITYIMH
jgi:hypothetical protein